MPVHSHVDTLADGTRIESHMYAAILPSLPPDAYLPEGVREVTQRYCKLVSEYRAFQAERHERTGPAARGKAIKDDVEANEEAILSGKQLTGSNATKHQSALSDVIREYETRDRAYIQLLVKLERELESAFLAHADEFMAIARREADEQQTAYRKTISPYLEAKRSYEAALGLVVFALDVHKAKATGKFEVGGYQSLGSRTIDESAVTADADRHRSLETLLANLDDIYTRDKLLTTAREYVWLGGDMSAGVIEVSNDPEEFGISRRKPRASRSRRDG